MADFVTNCSCGEPVRHGVRCRCGSITYLPQPRPIDELRQRASTCPNFELVYRVTERAAMLIGPHSTLSLGDAVKLACERLRVCLDDEGFALVVVALGFRRVRQQARLEALEPTEDRCRFT